jgi:transcription initiation factor TFIID subunit TAF12
MIESFVVSVTNGSCLLAKHRKGKTVEIKDVQLYLSKINLIISKIYCVNFKKHISIILY